MEIDELMKLANANPEASMKLLRDNPDPIRQEILNKINGLPASPELLRNMITEFMATQQGSAMLSKMGITKDNLGAGNIMAFYNFLKTGKMNG